MALSLVALVFVLGICWILRGLHHEGREALYQLKQRETTAAIYPFRRMR